MVGLNFGEIPSPVSVPFFPSAPIQSPSIPLPALDIAGLPIGGPSRQPPQSQPQSEKIRPYYSRSQNKFFVGGYEFGTDDAQAILETSQFLGQPTSVEPPAGDWAPIDEGEYANIVNRVRDPSITQGAIQSARIGAQQLKQLAGRGLQLYGAEETGGAIAQSAEEELRKLSPFQRSFTDDGPFLSWFTSTLANQGPMLLESIAVAIAGGLVGTFVGGPGLGTVAGSALATSRLGSILMKKPVRDRIVAAAEKWRKNPGSIDKDSPEYKLLRQAAGVTGAVTASFAGGAFLGGGDIYGEMREQGVEADDFGARLKAIGLSIPYAATDLLPEFFIASRILGVGGRAALEEGASFGARALEYGVKRPAAGFALYAPIEGTAEVIQEGLVLGGSGQSLTSPEAVDRFINAFAAGAATGGTVGAIANLRSSDPENLLNFEIDPVEVQKRADSDAQLLGRAKNYEQAQYMFSIMDRSSFTPEQVAQLQRIVDKKPRSNFEQKVKNVNEINNPIDLLSISTSLDKNLLTDQQFGILDEAIKTKANQLFPSFLETIKQSNYFIDVPEDIINSARQMSESGDLSAIARTLTNAAFETNIRNLPSLLDQTNVFSPDQVAQIKQILADKYLSSKDVEDALNIAVRDLKKKPDTADENVIEFVNETRAFLPTQTPFEKSVFDDRLIDIVIEGRKNQPVGNTFFILRNLFADRSPTELNDRIIRGLDETEGKPARDFDSLVEELDAAPSYILAERIYNRILRDSPPLSADQSLRLRDSLLSHARSAYGYTPVPAPPPSPVPAQKLLPAPPLSRPISTLGVITGQYEPVGLDYWRSLYGPPPLPGTTLPSGVIIGQYEPAGLDYPRLGELQSPLWDFNPRPEGVPLPYFDIDSLLSEFDNAKNFGEAQSIYNAIMRDNPPRNEADQQLLISRVLDFVPYDSRELVARELAPTATYSGYGGPQQAALTIPSYEAGLAYDQYMNPPPRSSFAEDLQFGLGEQERVAREQQQTGVMAEQDYPAALAQLRQQQRQKERASAAPELIQSETGVDTLASMPLRDAQDIVDSMPVQQPASPAPAPVVESGVEGYVQKGEPNGYRSLQDAQNERKNLGGGSIKVFRKGKKFYLREPTYTIVGNPEGYKGKGAATKAKNKMPDSSAVETFEYESRFYLRKPIAPPPDDPTPSGGGAAGERVKRTGRSRARRTRAQAGAGTQAQTAATPQAPSQTAPQAQTAAVTPESAPAQTEPEVATAAAVEPEAPATAAAVEPEAPAATQAASATPQQQAAYEIVEEKEGYVTEALAKQALEDRKYFNQRLKRSENLEVFEDNGRFFVRKVNQAATPAEKGTKKPRRGTKGETLRKGKAAAPAAAVEPETPAQAVTPESAPAQAAPATATPEPAPAAAPKAAPLKRGKAATATPTATPAPEPATQQQVTYTIVEKKEGYVTEALANEALARRKGYNKLSSRNENLEVFEDNGRFFVRRVTGAAAKPRQAQTEFDIDQLENFEKDYKAVEDAFAEATTKQENFNERIPRVTRPEERAEEETIQQELADTSKALDELTIKEGRSIAKSELDYSTIDQDTLGKLKAHTNKLVARLKLKGLNRNIRAELEKLIDTLENLTTSQVIAEDHNNVLDQYSGVVRKPPASEEVTTDTEVEAEAEAEVKADAPATTTPKVKTTPWAGRAAAPAFADVGSTSGYKTEGEAKVYLSNYNPIDGVEIYQRDDGKFYIRRPWARRNEKITKKEDAIQATKEVVKAASKTRKATKSGKTFRIDAVPEKSIGRGKLNMLIRGILDKYFNKPRMIVVDNLEAFRDKFPNEYRKAKEEYTEGNFDDVLAAGYSYRDGDKAVTVLFADMIPTEQAARFITAHENIGHFGFRSILSNDQLNKVLNAVYEKDFRVRRLADEQATAQNIDRFEATEEVLADMAAALDTSTVLRMWAGVKSALENLTGAKFDDYVARHFIQQSRAYVRNGKVSGRLVDLIAIAESIQNSNSTPSESTGRFMRRTTDLYRENQMAGVYNLTKNLFSPRSFGEIAKSIKDSSLDTREGFDKFKKNFFGLSIHTLGENEGSSAGLAAIQAGSDKASSIKEYTNELLKDYLNVGLFNTNFLGIKQDTYDSINNLIYAANRYFSEKYDPTKLPKLKDVVNVDVDSTGQATVTIDKKAVDKLFEDSTISIKDVREGFKWDVQVGDDPTNIVTDEFKGISDITGKTDSRYQGYIKARQTIRYIWEQLVIAKFESLEYNRVISYEEIAQVMRDKELKAEQRKFIKEIYDKFLQIYNSDLIYDETSKQYTYNPDSIDRAEKFAADANKVIIIEDNNTAEYAKNLDDFTAAFEPKTPDKADAIRKKLEAFRGEFERPQGKDNPDLFTIQNTIRKLGYEELSARDSDVNTFLQSIVTSYAPLVRRGEKQSRVMAYDQNGRIVKLQDDYASMLVYRQFDSLTEAKNFAEWFENTAFKENGESIYYNVKVIDPTTHTAVEKQVRFEVVVEDVQTENSAPPQLNLNEFQRGLRHFNIILPPKKMKEVIVGLTKQDASARKRLLRRADVPGASPDALRAVAELADSMGATIGKVTARPRLTELMNLKSRRIQEMWNGSKNRLENLQKEWERVRDDPTASRQRKDVAKRVYFRYKYWYDKTNPEKGVSRANDYRNRLGNLITFMDNARQFDQTNLEANKYISTLRTITSIVQLGGSIATGTLNYIGMAINGPAYLATYNEKTNEGGGFGAGKSITAIHKALSDIGMVKAILEPNLNRADFYFSMLDKNEHSKGAAAKLRAKYNLTEAEADFIGTEILEGRMIPAQMNSVMNTSRGQFLNVPGLAKFVDLYMKPFALTEQGSRRGLGLAAFRLEYDRSLVAFKELGRSDAEAAELAAQRAKEFAVETLDKTLGQYSITNRPPFFTGGVFSLLYMYKVFPTTTIQLLAKLDRPGQLAMVTSLFLLSGLAGMPFAEDIEDVIDTIMQQVGRMTNTPWRGARIELAESLNEIIPGVSPYVIRGAMNSFLTVDVASRTSVGNFVPGTSFPLAGSDTKQELLELGGPMAGMLAALAQTIPNAVRAATGDPRVSLVDVFRESPVTMMRAFGDAFAYTSTGAIVDRRGYVLEPEATTGAIVGRLMGWYPASAAEQYEVVRYSQRMVNFQKEIALSYRLAWVKASINKDRDSMRAIEDAVRDWNEGAKGTSMEIRNFLVGARRALREAERPGVERYLRTTPRQAREDLQYVEELFSY